MNLIDYCYDSILFSEVEFTQHNINHFKVKNLVAFSTSITLCNHHLYLLPKHCHHPKRKPCSH